MIVTGRRIAWRRVQAAVAAWLASLAASAAAAPPSPEEWAGLVPLPQPTLTFSLGLTHDSFSWQLPPDGAAAIGRLRQEAEHAVKAGRLMEAAEDRRLAATLIEHYQVDPEAQRQELTAALTAVEARLAAAPQDAAAGRLKAELLLSLKRPQAAMDVADAITARDPSDWMAYALAMRARTRQLVSTELWRELARLTDAEETRTRLRELLVPALLWRNRTEEMFAGRLKEDTPRDVSFYWAYYQFSMAANTLGTISGASELIFRRSRRPQDENLIKSLAEPVLDTDGHVELLQKAVATGKATLQVRAHLVVLRLLKDVYAAARRASAMLGLPVDNPVTLYLMLYKTGPKDLLAGHVAALQELEREAPGRYWELPLLEASVQLALGHWQEAERLFGGGADRCPLSGRPVQGLLLTALVHSQDVVRSAREAEVVADVEVKRLAKELTIHADEQTRQRLAAAQAALAAARLAKEAAEKKHGAPLANPFIDQVAPTAIKLAASRMAARPDEGIGLWLAFLDARRGDLDGAAAAYEAMARIDQPEPQLIARYGRLALRIRQTRSVEDAELKELTGMCDAVPSTQQAVTVGMLKAALSAAYALRGELAKARETIRASLDYVDPTGSIERVAQRLEVVRGPISGDMNLALKTVGLNRDRVIGVLVDAGLTREQAGQCADTAPCTVLRGLSRERGQQIKRKLEDVGATAELY
jgi:tetratricopeptide (TPR) repeat protein